MKTIKIKNGILKYPDEWIAIKNKDPEDCEYCGVIECRNSSKYHIPKFIFFQEKQISEMNNNDYQAVNEACIKRYPEFKDILECQVEPKYDEKLHLINEKEWMDSPVIGYFPVPDSDAIGLHCGADIFRD